MKTATPGWLEIVRGPWDSGEYYLPADYQPGDVVPVTLPEKWRGHGVYRVSADGKALVWGKR